jgi:LPS export ABC transporter protein LptC
MKRITGMRLPAVAVGAALLLLPFLGGCKEERKVDVTDIDTKKMPMMRTVNVNTLISDSGIVQYKIVSPLWLVYDNEIDTPYWSFPKGLYLRKYDRFFNVIATVACDSAHYLKRERIWRLDGNVELTRQPKSLFQTQQLFWDERQRLVYTDSFIHIETPTHVIEGEGFHSNDQLTSYRIIHPTGIFPVEASPQGGGASGASGAPRTTPAPAPSANTPVNAKDPQKAAAVSAAFAR